MIHIVQSTWEEDDDIELMKYLGKVEILSRADIERLSKIPKQVPFIDTDLVESMLTGIYEPPDTYPKHFQPLYHRNIAHIEFGECFEMEKPFFIKPATNSKLFSGTVVRDHYDLEHLEYQDIDHGTVVYVSNVVKFVNEYRMIVRNGELQTILNATNFVIPSEDVNEHLPPKDFVDKVMELNKDFYVIIDVGMFEDGRWAIVEINPPYSFTAYGMDTCEYVNYCQEAWEWCCKTKKV